MTTAPIDKTPNIVSPYNQGYLVGELCQSFFEGGILKRVPQCPFEADTQDYRSWFAGLIDNVSDREAKAAA